MKKKPKLTLPTSKDFKKVREYNTIIEHFQNLRRQEMANILSRFTGGSVNPKKAYKMLMGYTGVTDKVSFGSTNPILVKKAMEKERKWLKNFKV